MKVDRELDHLEGGNHLSLVFRVRQTRIRQVERGVDLLLRHGREWRVDDDRAVAHPLQQPRGVVLVRLLLDVAEILRLLQLVAQALLVREEQDIVRLGFHRPGHVDRLADVADLMERLARAQACHQLADRQLAHAIDEQVGRAVDQDAGQEPVFPIVVVRQSPQGGLDAAQHDRHVGIKLFQDLSIDDAWIVGPHARPPVGRISVVAAQPPIGRIMVHHRVHGAGRDPKEKPWLAELLEVAVVAPPVGLRHDGHPQALGLEHPSDHRRAKRGVIHVSIATENNHVQIVPSPGLDLLFRRRQPGIQSISCLHAAKIKPFPRFRPSRQKVI